MNETEELLRGLVPGLDACLREIDAEADPGSPGWHAMRARIFALAAQDTDDLHEADILLTLSDRESVTVELMGPAAHWSEDIAAAVGALHTSDPQLIELAVPDYRPVSDTTGNDDSSGSDIQQDTSGAAFARHMSQRGASAGWSRPGTAPQQGRQPSAGQSSRRRVRSVNRRRAKQVARAVKMHRAAMRFRLRGAR